MIAFKEQTVEKIITAIGIVGVILAVLGIITLLIQILIG